MDRDDKALLDRALAGDAEAKRAVVVLLLPTVRARVTCALVRAGRREQAAQVASDLTQQVFLRLFDDDARCLRAWDPARGAALRTFVGLLAEREVIALLRRGARNPWTESPTDGDELARKAGAARDYEATVVERQWLDAVLDRVLAKLDERGILLFQRLVVDEANVDEVARETGASPAALYMWKNRFTKAVRGAAAEMSAETKPVARAPQLTLAPRMR